MTYRMLAFIGSFAEEGEPGLYTCAFNPDTGEMEVLERVSGHRNPTFLTLDSQRRRLYVLDEVRDASGIKRGGAASYAIDKLHGKLRLLNRETVSEAPVSHIELDRDKRTLFLSSYNGGAIGVAAIVDGGRVGPLHQYIKHSHGSGVLPVQTQPRVHSVTMDRANRYAVVCDLGGDLIALYCYESDAQRLTPHKQVRAASGAGPRHFVFHPLASFGYVINELGSSITAYCYDPEEGILTEQQTVSTLPEGYTGDNATADIHVSPDGRFLYGSNRGHDSIAVYTVDPVTGKLNLVEHIHTGGGHPRNFGISPDGRFLLVANRDGNSVVTFVRNDETGRLALSGHVLELSKPVCIRFMEQKAGR